MKITFISQDTELGIICIGFSTERKYQNFENSGTKVYHTLPKIV